MGKFKNKKVLVKDIGKDEWGMPTINGKKAVTFRIPNIVVIIAFFSLKLNGDFFESVTLEVPM